MDLDQHRRIINKGKKDKSVTANEPKETTHIGLRHVRLCLQSIADSAHLREVALLVAGVATLVVTLSCH